MKTSHLALVGLGIIGLGLGAGCASSKDVQEIAYRETETDTSGKSDTTIVPEGTGTAVEGEGDEVITPTGPVAGADEYVASPESPAAPAVEVPAAPESPVAEETPELGEPAAALPPPVSCDEKAFAFVSKRGTREDVYAMKEGRVQRLTSNNHDFRYFKNLSVKPGSRTLAYGELFILHPLVPIPATTISLGDLGETTPAFEALGTTGLLPHGLAWNQDGTKAAYFSHRIERGKTLTDIQVIDAATRGLIRTIAVDRLGMRTFGKLTWWGDSLIYDVTYSGLDSYELYVVDSRSSGAASDVVYVRDSGIVFDRNRASDPAVSPTGNVLAYVDDLNGDGRLTTCGLSGDRFPAYAVDAFPCRGPRVLTTVGNVTSPSWSPDGRWIYFVSDRDGNKEIYRIRPDGTGEERLTNDPAADTSPAPFAAFAGCE